MVRAFAEIGRQFPGIDLIVLKNGQYNADWEQIHTPPSEQPLVCRDLGAKEFVTGYYSPSTRFQDMHLTNRAAIGTALKGSASKAAVCLWDGFGKLWKCLQLLCAMFSGAAGNPRKWHLFEFPIPRADTAASAKCTWALHGAKQMAGEAVNSPDKVCTWLK